MNDIFPYFRDLLERGIAFATAQAPGIVEQVATRHWVSFGAELLFSGIFAALYIAFLRAAFRMIRKLRGEDEMGESDAAASKLIALVVLSLLLLPFFMSSVGAAFDELAAALTPELSAIERVTR
tara:strand:+ start:1421 stop:1792 length:372 start_codon:yes stop_codon:yes gene_type:complete